LKKQAYRVAIITASDSGFAGKREDKSAEVIRELVTAAGYETVSYELLPDDREMISQAMTRICDNSEAELILTTGGTGFSPRDVTPEATADVIERPVPGIPEAMRQLSLRITDRAMLSRAAAGIRGKTLIVNLPGSPKAVRECLEFILPAVSHGLDILTGADSECAR
jgi:molybdopterin adenylyltransferase